MGYTDSTIGLHQRYWREYYIFHGSFDVDEKLMNEFLLRAYDIQQNNINISKRQYEVRAAIRNLLEFHRHGKIVNYHTPWFTDIPWVDSYKDIMDAFFKSIHDNRLSNNLC